MGMIERFKGIFATRKAEPPAESGGLLSLWPMRSEAGVYVDEDGALGVAAVYACATLGARSIGVMGWHVHRPTADGRGIERVPNSAIEPLLDREPNPEMTAVSWREGMLLTAMLHGNAFSEIERDTSGRPIGLWPIEHQRVQIRRDAGELIYEIDLGPRGKVELTGREIFHLKGPTLDGVEGLSVVQYARHTFGLAIAQDRFASNFLRNGAAPSGVLSVPMKMQQPEMDRLRHQVEARYAGPRGAGRILIADQGTKFDAISVSQKDAEFIEQRRFSVEEVCRWFGCPPQKIADTSKQTFANFEQANLSYWIDGLMPWAVRLEQEANRKLFFPGRTHFTRLNSNALLRADTEKQTAAFTAGIEGGWLSPNEVRAMLGMPPRVGGDSYAAPGSKSGEPQASAPVLKLRGR